MTSPVLIPVDMQRAFDAPPFGERANPALDDNGRVLLAAWRRHGRPIIHVRHDSIEPHSTLRPGLPGHAFRAGFEPHPDEAFVTKSVNAAFIGTDLDLRLRRLDTTEIVIFGLTTDRCVSTTTRIGANLGYAMTVVADACDCFGATAPDGTHLTAETIHAAHLATLAEEFARVVTTRELLAELPKE